MASIYKRKRSPYWWIKFKDPATGKHVSVSSKIKLTAPKKQIELRLAQVELDEKINARDHKKSGAFADWVPNFITSHFKGGKASAKIRYAHLVRYMTSQGIYFPDQIKYDFYDGYLAFRIGDGVCKNTANMEYHFLNQLMKMAEDAGYITRNPLRNRRISRDTPIPKNLITTEEIKTIRDAIATDMQRDCFVKLSDVASMVGITTNRINQILSRGTADKSLRSKIDAAISHTGYRPGVPSISKSDWIDRCQFLHASCEIMWLQGLRIGETYFHLYDHVDLERMQLKIKAKGDRYYQPPINPELKKLILKWRQQKRVMTFPDQYECPKKRAGVWYHFLKRLKLSHLSAHCFRVTFISRAINAGIPMGKVMKLTNHSREAISLIYQRFDQSQMADVWDSIT